MTISCQNLFREADTAPHGTTRRSVIRSVTRSARAVGPLGRSAAIATTIIALVSALQNGVPAASAISVALLVPAATVDIVEQRLPNQIIAASALTLAIGLILNSNNVTVRNVMLGVALLAGPLLVLHLIAPGSMGFGDVKMALVLGAAVGAVHWQLALVTIAFASGASATVALLRRMTEIALGPGLVGASAFSLLTHTLMLTPAALESTISIGHFA